MKYLKIQYNLISLPIFLSLYFIYSYVSDINFPLKHISQISADIGTLEGIDIHSRVSFYYKIIASFFISFFLLNILFNWFYNKSDSIKGKLEVASNLSLWGIVLLFLFVLKANVAGSITFIIGGITAIVFCGLLTLADKKSKTKETLYHELIFQAAISYFILVMIYFFRYSKYLPSALSIEWLYCLTFIVVQLLWFIIDKKIKLNADELLSKLRWFALTPILPFISTELYLIFNQHNIFILSPQIIFLILFIAIVLLSILFRKKYFIKTNTIQFIEKFWLLMILFGIAMVLVYQPIIEQPKELFELANKANAVMLIFKYHQIPFFNFFNSHLISDYFFNIFYIIFYGYDGSINFVIYDFFEYLILIGISFFVISKMFNDNYFAFAFVIFFPFLNEFICEICCVALLTVFLINKLFESYSLKRLLYIFFFNLLLMVWKIDIAISNTFATLVLLLVFFIFYYDKSKLYDLLKIFISLIIFALLVFTIAVLCKVPVFSNIKQILDYLGASQQHGFPIITYNYDRTFFWYYIIFPLIASIISIFVISKMKFYLIEKTDKFNFVLLIFSIAYYFMNAQRSLVRHSLVEGLLMVVSSFIFLILGVTFIIIFQKYSWLKKGSLIFIVLIMQAFIYPNFDGRENILSVFPKHINDIKKIKPVHEKIQRVINDENFKNDNYIDFKKFLDDNFPGQSTFIDFSNTPMLYFYTGRQVPSYFCQYMQNTVTDYLQDENLKYLNNFDIPVVVFSNYPETWFDKTDDVPNSVRYYKIANHIFENYEPYNIISSHYIWIKKGLSVVSDGIIHKPQDSIRTFELKKYPYYLGESDFFIKANVLSNNILNNFPENKFSKANNYFEINLKSNVDTIGKGVVCYYDCDSLLGSFNFNIESSVDVKKYIIPMSAQYNWWNEKVNKIKVFIEPESKIEIISSRLIAL